MRRRTGIALLYALFMLVILGVGFRRWEPVVVAVPVFVFYGISCFRGIGQAPKVTVRRHISPQRTTLGEQTRIKVEVTNRRGAKLEQVELFDKLPDSVEIKKGSNHQLFSLQPYETKYFTYTVKSHVKGKIPLGPTLMRDSDYMNFFFSEKSLENKGHFIVQHQAEDMRKLVLKPSHSRRLMGNIPARGKGTGGEFFSLREYNPSDSMRVINWKATGRLDRLISTEFQDERLGDVIILIDVRLKSKIGTGDLNTTDASVKGACALAQRVLRDKNRLSFVYIGERIGWIPGITARRYIMRELEEGRLPAAQMLYSIHWLPWIIRSSFSTSAFIVVFSPLRDDDIVRMLLDIASRGYETVVISPSPESTDEPIEVTDPARGLGKVTLSLRRENRMLRLRRAMKVLDWNILEPLTLPLKRMGTQRGGRPMIVTRGPRRK